MKMKDCVFLALDGGMSPEEAIELAESIGRGQVLGFKANDLLDTCLIEGYSLKKLVKELKKYGLVFWADQKFTDVANTVGNRVKNYKDSGVDLITVMASGGVGMIRNAILAAGDTIDIIGVTVPTDRIEEDAYLDLGGPVRANVLKYARNVLLAGGYKIVCSGEELDFLSQFPELLTFAVYVPAIRPEWAAKKGQVRITTPTDALQKGAVFVHTKLVIGSPAYAPPKNIGTPSDAVQKIAEEIEKIEA
jgi:orotidine-5'-phosphate decarboxylase